MTAIARTPQENAAVILRTQLDAAELLRRAEREERAGASAILLSLEEVKRIAGNMVATADIKEREHLAIYGHEGHGARRG